MAEPTRKQTKQHGNSNVLLFPQVTDETSLVFITTHKTHPCQVDLTEFRDGGKAPVGKGSNGWGGDFSGRPLLIEQLLPHIRAFHSTQSEVSLKSLTSTLRTYWRLLTACDSLPIEQRPKPVDSVADLTDLHDRLQVRNRINGDQTRVFTRLASAARKQIGLTQLDWKPNDTRSNPQVRITLDLRQTRAIYHEVKNYVRTIYTCWENDLTLVPSKRDCLYILVFLMIKTGWNEAVALNIDCEDYLRPHIGDSDRHVLHSIKIRSGGTTQVHVGRNQEEWSPGNLVKKLIERSEPLREPLRKQLVQLQKQTQDQKLTVSQTLQIAKLKRNLQSVWLHATRAGVKEVENFNPSDPAWTVKVLTHSDVNSRTFAGGINLITFLQRQVNSSLTCQGHPPIEKIALSDVRDAYINWAYSSTGYEWMMAKLAAGHTSVQSAITYLRTRALKQHGEAAVRQLTTIVFDEIKTQRSLDPIFLYARVNRSAVSDEQRERWMKGRDRTRVGMGCADFKHPPKHMAPHHQEGKGCRTQRCTLCEHAVVFEDSYTHLARRKAELLVYQESMGLMMWATTDFPDELRKVDQTLQSYDPVLINVTLAHWQEEIDAGRHIPPTFEGSYE